MALSTTSNRITASGATPSAVIAAILMTIDSRISNGWKRTPVVTIEVEIGVMHHVQPPQAGHRVKH